MVAYVYAVQAIGKSIPPSTALRWSSCVSIAPAGITISADAPQVTLAQQRYGA
jgi:hypothetical protein